MSLAGYGADGRKMWRCDRCGLVAPWGDSWSWFGSFFDAEWPGELPTFCSADCKPAIAPLMPPRLVSR